MSNYFSRISRLARRAIRSESFAELGDALHGHRKQAAYKLTTQNAGPEAVELVRDILGNYTLPSKPNLGASSVRNIKTASNNKLDSGVITVHAEFRTKTGVNVGIDIPVEIRDGEFIEPSVIVVAGSPRIIAQSTFSAITESNTLYEDEPVRDMYAAPMDTRENKHSLENRGKRERSNKGMFSASATGNREALRAVVAGKATTAQYVEFDYEDAEPGRNADQDSWLDPAERKEEFDVHAGDELSLTETVEVRNRGGGVVEYTKGTKCLILRDVAGDNTSFAVQFDDGRQAIVERHLVKKV